jgi:penicillin amidase
MRAWPTVSTCLVAAVLCGCSSKSSSPAVSLTPSGTVQATGPILVTAAVLNSSAQPTWTLAGPGSLSGTSGHSVVYAPPASGGAGQTATVTASVAGASASLQVQIATPALAAVHIPGLTAAVQVLTDDKDIPHIRCAATVDCLAVQGYLQARDRLFQMDFLRRLARGRLAELVGPLALDQDVQLRTLFTTRDGQRLEDALVAALNATNAARIGAYIGGVNAYLAHLRAAPAEMPGEYGQLPVPVAPADIPDWTPADVLALARLQQFELSETLFEETDYGTFAQVYGPAAPHQDLGKMNTWIRAAAPGVAQTHTLVQNAVLPPLAAPSAARSPAAWGQSLAALHARAGALRAALRPVAGSFGSNNWVVDAAHSTSGHAMVANDPHLSLPYPPNFHLAALTSTNPADNLDVNGGSFPGIPGALVGRGKNVGWGVTVVGYDVTDLYLEQALPGCPGGVPANTAFCVLYQGAPAPVLAYPQTFQVRTATGLANAVGLGLLPADQSLVAVVPHHGPIVQAPDAGGHAVSVRWTGHEGWTQDLSAFLGMAVAAGVDGAMTALNDYATGAQNFVLADDAGHIAYYPHALVPIRNFADARVTAPANLIPPWFPLPGDGSAEWGDNDPTCNGPAAPRSCFIADADLPQGKDPAWGYFATANADPLGVSDDNNPLAHPPYLSFDWSDSTGFRHARIVSRLKATTAAGGKVSLADMQSIQSDHVSALGKAFADILASPAFDPAAAASPDFAAARAMLAAWGAAANPVPYDCPTGLLGTDPVSSPADPSPTNQANSASCFLFHVFLRTLLGNVFADDLKVAGLPVGAVQAVKGMLYMLDPATPAADQTFCRDVDPGGNVVKATTCAEQVVEALVTAFDTLAASKGPQASWLWGRSHTFTAASLFPTVTVGYQAGPFAHPGGAFTVDVGNPDLAGQGTSFTFGSSGNVRHISAMDPASPTVKMQLPGPQRDGPFGVVLGPDLIGEWAANRYFDYATSAQIGPIAVSSQTFSP